MIKNKNALHSVPVFEKIIMKKTFLILAFTAGLIIYNAHIYAQTCPDWPAACPNDNYVDEDRLEDSTQKMLNPIVSEEVTMQYRLRELTGSLVRRVAQKEHWNEPVEIYEYASSGFRDANENVLAYPIRPPHWVKIVWQVIVNKDSMQQWIDWLKDLGTRAQSNINDYANKMTAVQDVYKRYMDSANHYGDLKGDYMSAHYAKYQQDIVTGNKTGIAAYEKAVAVYDDKANAFVKKATDLQKDAGAEKAQDDIQTERVQKSLIFRESVVLFIEFDFNSDRGDAGRCECKPIKGETPSNGFKVVRWFTNPQPTSTNVIDYSNSTNVAYGLLGGWTSTPDSRGIYWPSYHADQKAIDKLTPKKIKTDRVQSICIHVSSNKAAMQKFFTDLDTEELNKVIIKN